MGKSLNYDFTDNFVLFPRNLQEAHDQVAILFDTRKSEFHNNAIREAYKQLRERYCFTKDGFTVIPPKTAKEIVAEGHALHHCVHSYVERVAEGRCIVLFIREKDNVKKPFYTVEVRNNRIIQIHGKNHSAPTPELKKFLDTWEIKKLSVVNGAIAA
jgi:hypothetical protein